MKQKQCKCKRCGYEWYSKLGRLNEQEVNEFYKSTCKEVGKKVDIMSKQFLQTLTCYEQNRKPVRCASCRSRLWNNDYVYNVKSKK